jgi:dienelactone hydrolase
MKRFFPSVFLLAVWAGSSLAQAAIKPVEYKQGPTALEGLVVVDPAAVGQRPGVLLAHEHGAASIQARAKATQLARQGYVVFSADLYGKGVTPKDGADAAARLELAKPDRTLVRARMAAALAALEQVPQVDPKRLAAVGYGAGGTAALELARARAEVEGVVCVHGNLTPTGKDGKNVSSALLIITGTEDPAIPISQIAAFEDEMRAGGVDWQLIRYGGASGDFTNPLAGRNLKSGRAYDAEADKRSDAAIRLFLTETFPPRAVAKAPARAEAPKGVPDKVIKVLDYVDKNNEPMKGYEGGRSFGNFEKRLAATDSAGRRIKYREWDVNPLRPGVNRGPERLVTGSDGSAYYTEDHYATFKKIR